ncbi:uncharacterized protein ABKV19_006653 [Rosa sericea]
MTMSCFGPLFRWKPPSGRKGTKGSNRPKSLPPKQNVTKSTPADDSYGVAGNSALTMALRKKIVTFRDVMDLPTCNASSPINQLVMGLMLDLQKLYPEIVRRSQLSEMKGSSTEKILASFRNALKSIGDSWMTNHDRLDKLRYDMPSFKENANWEQHVGTVLATLECLIKMARDKFDMMDEDEQKSNCSPRGNSFGRFLGDTDSESYTSSCPSPITPSSVLPEVIDSGSPKSQRRSKASSRSPVLLTLRVQAVGKLNPIDVKHLSLHLSNEGASDKSNKLVDEPSRETVESSSEKSSEEENRCSSTGIIDNRNCDDVGISTTAPETLAVDITELPPPSPPPNLTTTIHVTPPPSLPTLQPKAAVAPPSPPPPPTLPVSPSLPTLQPTVAALPPPPPPPPLTLAPLNAAPARRPAPPPPKALRSTKAAPPPSLPTLQPKSAATPPSPPLPPTLPVPPSLPTLQPTVAAPPPPPPLPPPTLTPLNAAPARRSPPPPPPPKVLGSTKAAPPPPPPLPMAPGSTAAGPPTPPPMPVATASAPPPPPPMGRPANGAAPPPPPALGGRSLLMKKSNTKLKRSSQMGSLYRTLKGKVEGSSLNGKSSNGRKGGAAGSSAAGGKGMADALAEMTKRSAYFQQIEEDVQKYSKAIINMRTTLSSFQTKDMNELLEFHKKVESILENLTDETQVLSRFEGFPTKKLETMRAAVALHSQLNAMITELHNWKIEAPLGPLLDKIERYFTKIKGEIDKLERTKDEEIKKFKSQNIHFDFNILIRIKEAMVDVSSGCMELALKERREAKASGEAQTTGTKTDKKQLKICIKMLWRAFQFAFKVYTFAGGHDDRADMLTRELASEIESDPYQH